MTAIHQNDRAAWLQGPCAVCSPPVDALETPWRLVLLGAPGVGKGTQAALLNARLGACHLSTGDIFRAAAPTPAMEEAKRYIRSGELVPDQTVWEMVHERGGCLNCGGGFLLDGFPRTLGQAESLQAYLKQEGIALDAVVDYELPLDEIVDRLSGRRICRGCKKIFHVSGGTADPARCDHCGGVLYQREDDRPEAIKVRMQIYESSTAPLIRFYQEQGLLVPVSAAGEPAQIFERTLAALEQLRQN